MLGSSRAAQQQQPGGPGNMYGNMAKQQVSAGSYDNSSNVH